jgi:hypothetical protein
LTIWQLDVSLWFMSNDERRRILLAVATGDLTPADAAAALDDLGGGEEAGAPDDPPSDLLGVRVEASARVVRVVGDPGVREAVADGPHELRREGGTLVVSSDVDDEADGAFFSAGPGWWMRGRVDHRARTLSVRMHPSLALDVDVNAGSLDVRDVRGPIRVGVAAANVRIVGFAAPLDLEAAAGRIDASGVLDRGSSRVRCQAGHVTLRLDPGSSVRVTGRATAGRVVLPGDDLPGHRAGRRLPGEERKAVVGDGAGTLDVEVSTGSAVVRTGP